MPSEISIELIESFMGPLSIYVEAPEEEGQIWTLLLNKGSAEIRRLSWADMEGLADEGSIQRTRAVADCCALPMVPVVVLASLCTRPGCTLVHAHLIAIEKTERREDHGQAGRRPV